MQDGIINIVILAACYHLYTKLPPCKLPNDLKLLQKVSLNSNLMVGTFAYCFISFLFVVSAYVHSP